MRARRLQRLRDRRDDLDAYLWRWKFAMAPSDIRKAREQLARLDAKIQAAAPVSDDTGGTKP